jgi:hypothetical protein
MLVEGVEINLEQQHGTRTSRAPHALYIMRGALMQLVVLLQLLLTAKSFSSFSSSALQSQSRIDDGQQARKSIAEHGNDNVGSSSSSRIISHRRKYSGCSDVRGRRRRGEISSLLTAIASGGGGGGGAGGSNKNIMHVCSDCGAESVKWVGRCPSCREWNTMKVFRIAKEGGAKSTISKQVRKTRLR